MKKLLSTIITISLFASCSTSLISCGRCEHIDSDGDGICDECSDTVSKGERAIDSSGLAIELNADKSSYTVTGIGSCTQKDIHIGYFNGLPITEIRDGAFKNCNSITSVSLDDCVKRIGSSAFYGCTSLTSVSLGEGVSDIEPSSFYGCYKLVEVINKSALDVSAGSAGYGDVALYAKEVHGAESRIVSLDDYLFYTHGGINYLIGYAGDASDLTLPESFNGQSFEIYKYAFKSYDNLTGVSLGKGVSKIGSYAFAHCGLSSIDFDGTQGEWAAIPKGSSWDYGNGSYTITYNHTEK